MRRNIDYVIEPCILCSGSGKSTVNSSKIDLPCVPCRGLGMEYLTKKEWHSRMCKDKTCRDFIHSDIIFAFRKVSIALGIWYAQE